MKSSYLANIIKWTEKLTRVYNNKPGNGCSRDIWAAPNRIRAKHDILPLLLCFLPARKIYPPTLFNNMLLNTIRSLYLGPWTDRPRLKISFKAYKLWPSWACGVTFHGPELKWTAGRGCLDLRVLGFRRLISPFNHSYRLAWLLRHATM